MAAELTLASPFSSRMVLQRGRRNLLWGWDRPAQRVEVHVEGGREPVTVRDFADASDGAFCLELPALPAGGPYRLVVRGSSERVLEDVLVGDVWLASGQSTMEWPVRQAAHAEEEIPAARLPSIRYLYVARVAARTAARTVPATWHVVSSDTVGDMSAVAFYFAREVHARSGVPIGIVDASWGGTPIEAWTSVEALRPMVPELDAQLAAQRLPSAEIERIRADYLERLARWEASHLPADPGNVGEKLGWAQPTCDVSSWRELRLPAVWQRHGMRFNGVVWFRHTLQLPAAWAGHDLVLSLGAIDDFDHTYFNGELVGSHPKGTPEACRIQRVYRVPARLVRPGANVVAVRVFDHVGEGGFLGPSTAMSVETSAPGGGSASMAGVWQCRVEHPIALVPTSVFATYPLPPAALATQHAPAALYHGMLAPLAPFGLRGFIWYQGESNVDAHATYRRRLVALVRDLRTRFGQGQLPFYFVQLAAHAAGIEWAYLREAQSEALSEPATGMATAIDLGDPHDIHPAEKREVGRRLALLALRDLYGFGDLEASGPVARSVEIGAAGVRGGEARVRFAHAQGLTTRDGTGRPIGFELAGGDMRFCAAEARVDGESVVLSAAAVPRPVAVRYAFRDCPEVNLVNGAGLPALPFRTDCV